MTDSKYREALTRMQNAISEHSVILPRIEAKLDKINGCIKDHETRISNTENSLDSHLAVYKERDKLVNRWTAPVITGIIIGLVVVAITSFAQPPPQDVGVFGPLHTNGNAIE